MSHSVFALGVAGSEFVVGGDFRTAGGLPVNRIAGWNGCMAPVLAVDTTCPCGGPIRVSWQQATPNGQIALVFARAEGVFAIPNGFPCAGTRLGLGSSQIQLAFQGNAGANGSRTLNARAGPGACGGFLQLLDVATCATSNVARVE